MWGGWDRLDPRGAGGGLRVSQAKGRVLPQGMFRLNWIGVETRWA